VVFTISRHGLHLQTKINWTSVDKGRSSGRAAAEDQELLGWPPRSPDLTPCDFFLWGFTKDRVFVPPLPATLVDLRTRITAAITVIDTTCYKVFARNLITGLMCVVQWRLVAKISGGAAVSFS
jgi:hypothetical protein